MWSGIPQYSDFINDLFLIELNNYTIKIFLSFAEQKMKKP